MAKTTLDKNERQVSVVLNPEITPILYTDEVQITTNDFGVVIDSIQKIGPYDARVVSRLGMSRQHAKKLVEELAKTLIVTEEKKQRAND